MYLVNVMLYKEYT